LGLQSPSLSFLYNNVISVFVQKRFVFEIYKFQKSSGTYKPAGPKNRVLRYA
jgi:hypothetical protein